MKNCVFILNFQCSKYQNLTKTKIFNKIPVEKIFELNFEFSNIAF